jgi:hypothetical protein
MNEEFELRQRLTKADPASVGPVLNESVVAKAAMGKPARFASFRVARLTMAAASLSIVGLAATSLSLPQTAQEPLFVLSQGGAQTTNAMSTEAGTADGKMVADSMIMPWYRYNYIAGDLSTSTGRGKVYQAELVGNPIEILNRLAGYFGVQGQPKLDEWATPEYPSYSVMSNNKSLNIYFSGTGSWYYSSWRDYDYSCSANSSEGAEDSSELTRERTQEYCDPKPTPELIPAEAELVRQAVELFRGVGTSVDSSQARVWRDDWGAWVNFPNIQNGVNTGMDFHVGWDMAGQISYASGYSFRLIERGEFDTISALDAVPRIADGRWYGGAASHYYEDLYVTSDVAVSSPMARSPQEEVSIEAEIEAGGEKIEIIEPAPGLFYEEPEVMDLMVVRSEIATLSVFDAAGNFWFVPGYLLFNEQGWFDSIISLEEGIIQLPEPFNYDVMPLEEPQG